MAALAMALFCTGTTALAEPAAEKENDAATDLVIEMYRSGKQKVMWGVGIHAEPKAGQFWTLKTTTKAAGTNTESEERWSVVKVEGSRALVEYFSSTHKLCLAYWLDTSVKTEDIFKTGNVKRAWIGKKGGEPVECQIKPVPKGAPKSAKSDDKDTVVEDFKDLELAGTKWSGKTSTRSSKSGDTIVWIADSGWFGQPLKTESKMFGAEVKTELSACGTDGEAWLKWDGIKVEDAATGKPAEEGK